MAAALLRFPSAARFYDAPTPSIAAWSSLVLRPDVPRTNEALCWLQPNTIDRPSGLELEGVRRGTNAIKHTVSTCGWCRRRVFCKINGKHVNRLPCVCTVQRPLLALLS